MSVPAEKLMELMRGQRSAGTAAPKVEVEMEEKDDMSSEDTPPMGAPMSTPEPKMGSKEGALVNIGMVIGVLPVVGVPLPLVSYGGTSMVTLMAGFGILMSIHTHRKNLPV